MKIGGIYKIKPDYKKAIWIDPKTTFVVHSEHLAFLTMSKKGFKSELLFLATKEDIFVFLGPYEYPDLADMGFVRDSWLCQGKIGFFAIFDGPQDASEALIEIKE